MNNLALLLEAQGEALSASPRRARRNSLTLVSAKGLASLLKHQDKFSEAEPLFRRALEGHEAKLGCTHPLTLRSMAPWTSCLSLMAKPSEA